MFVGVRVSSNELMVIGQETKDVKMVRIVRRIPEDERWHADYLAWVTAVPWNKGRGDPDADGDAPSFDVSKGPGRQLTGRTEGHRGERARTHGTPSTSVTERF